MPLYIMLYLIPAPEIPRAPVIASADDGREIVIKLFTTSTKYGPIE